MKLQKVTPPSLPQASTTWTQRFQETFSNALRLFFTRIVGTLNSLLEEDGGRFLSFPHALFYDTTTQTAAAPNTAYAVKFNSVYVDNSVYKDTTDTSKIYVTHAGIYNFQFSLQLDQSSASTHKFWVWPRRNGFDAPDSGSEYALNGSTAEIIAALNYYIEMQPGDYFQLMWAVSSTNVFIAKIAAAPPVPAIPSAILSVNFVSESSNVSEVF